MEGSRCSTVLIMRTTSEKVNADIQQRLFSRFIFCRLPYVCSLASRRATLYS